MRITRLRHERLKQDPKVSIMSQRLTQYHNVTHAECRPVFRNHIGFAAPAVFLSVPLHALGGTTSLRYRMLSDVKRKASAAGCTWSSCLFRPCLPCRNGLIATTLPNVSLPRPRPLQCLATLGKLVSSVVHTILTSGSHRAGGRHGLTSASAPAPQNTTRKGMVNPRPQTPKPKLRTPGSPKPRTLFRTYETPKHP